MKMSPYELDGRYYRVFIESNGNNYVVTASDLDISIELDNGNSYLVLPEGFRANFSIPEFNLTSDCEILSKLRYKNSRFGIMLPPVAACDYGHVYIHGRFVRERG